MMHQPIPTVTPADVDRVIRRDFGITMFDRVTAELAEFGSENPSRVRLAILKLAAGDIEALHKYVKVANEDWRDVIAWAEYPQYMSHLPVPPALESEIISGDWNQYQDWLNR